MSPLTAFYHLADVSSPRVWFDGPIEQNDPWPGEEDLGLENNRNHRILNK